jgi:hypothetical protein
LNEVKSVLLPFFASLNAYPDVASLNSLEEKYWADKAKPSAAGTGPKTSGQVDSGALEAHNSHHGGGGMK